MPTLQQSLDAALGQPAPDMSVMGKVIGTPLGEEEHQSQILNVLDTLPKPAPGQRTLHIGAAGLFNLDMLAKPGYSAGLLVDINHQQELWWRDVITLLRNNKTPDAFMRAYGQRISTASLLYTARSGNERTALPLMLGQRGTMDEVDFYKHPDTYARLHTMAAAGQIATTTVDLVNDAPRVAALRRWIDGEGFTVRTIYPSNILDYAGYGGSPADMGRNDYYHRDLDSGTGHRFIANLQVLANNDETRTFLASVYDDARPLIILKGTGKAILPPLFTTTSALRLAPQANDASYANLESAGQLLRLGQLGDILRPQPWVPTGKLPSDNGLYANTFVHALADYRKQHPVTDAQANLLVRSMLQPGDAIESMMYDISAHHDYPALPKPTARFIEDIVKRSNMEPLVRTGPGPSELLHEQLNIFREITRIKGAENIPQHASPVRYAMEHADHTSIVPPAVPARAAVHALG